VALAALALSLLLAPAGAAAAKTFTWTGHTSADAWSEAGAWEEGTPPTPADGAVDLDFSLSGCEPWPAGCKATDDIAGLSVGKLWLQGRIIRFPSTGGPPVLPPAEPRPLSYEVNGAGPIYLQEGIEAAPVEVGSGEGVESSFGTTIAPQLVLGGPNAWRLRGGPELVIAHALTGDQPLSVELEGAGLGLPGGAEVGPVTLTGNGHSGGWVSLSEGQSLNAADGAPVLVEDADLSDISAVGPLALGPGGVLAVGAPFKGGDTTVRGDLTAHAGSSISFWNVGPMPLFGSVQQTLEVTGHATLEGARLLYDEGCPVPGTTYTVIAASGGVAGSLETAEGAPISNWQVLPGEAINCGGTSAPPLRIEYLPQSVTATALAAGTALLPAVQSPPSSSGSGVAGYSAVAARKALARDIGLASRSRRIGRLLREGGESVEVELPAAGVLHISWTCRHGHRTTALATGEVQRGSAGDARVRIRLTSGGRKLLRRSRVVKGKVLVSFLPVGEAPLSLAAPLTLRR
jgi:hypothetical protein